MPNPQTGTVSDDLTSPMKAVKAECVEFKIDKTANLAVVVGKRSFEQQKVVEKCKAATK